MMSSLVPGTIFIASGFNRKSTPTPPNVTPSELDNRYKRVNFNGKDWPHDSPVARSYDVGNTSTKLIILNNKYGKNSTRLRGYYTGPQKPDRSVDPDRHRAKSPRNLDWHHECYNSSSPKFEPAIKTDLEWVNSSHRPANALIAKSSVNPNRHATCRIPSEFQTVHSSRPSSRMHLPPSKYFNNSEYADLSVGEKIYLWGIERIYSMDKMKQLKQEQYKTLLDMEAKKGHHGAREYTQYMRYINSAKDRSYGTGSPSRSRSAMSYRSRSAASRHSQPPKSERSEDEKSEHSERPKTSLGHSQESEKDSKPPRTKSAASSDRQSVTSQQKSHSPSPSPSRKSSAKANSQRSLSQKSLRSKASSRASSAHSAKYSGKSDKGDDSDAEREFTPTHHKEGKDRPKSRLGHPHTDDVDKDSSHSSMTSIKSSSTLTSDSGVGQGEKKSNKPKEAVVPTGSNKMGSKASVTSKGSSKSDSKQKRNTNGKITAKDNDTFDQNETDEVKIHRVPSEGYIEGEHGTGIASSDDKATSDNEKKKQASDDSDKESENQTSGDEEKKRTENKQHVISEETQTEKVESSTENECNDHKAVQTETSKNIDKSNDIEQNKVKQYDGISDTDIDKGIQTDRLSEFSNSNQTDDAKSSGGESDRVRNKLNRQESFDESDSESDTDDKKGRKDPDKIEY